MVSGSFDTIKLKLSYKIRIAVNYLELNSKKLNGTYTLVVGLQTFIIGTISKGGEVFQQ